MAKAPKQSAGKYGTNGGNGGYNLRKTMDAGFDKPLKLSNAGKFAATGKTERKK